MLEFFGNLVGMLSAASPIIVLAFGFQAAGFLSRDQILLRCLVLISSGFYIAYYYTHDPSPLWDAIFGSSAIAMATLYGLVLLLLSRMTFTVPKHQRGLFRSIGELEPGLFRRLMKAGAWKTAERKVVVTVEGRVPSSLYYVISGTPHVLKGAARFKVESGCFLGEVSYILGSPASATVELPAGAEYIEWPRPVLEKLFRRSNRMKLAVEALIAQDMARKVARGLQPDIAATVDKRPVTVVDPSRRLPSVP